ncbi:choline ABC transporter substrate-binding protein [Oryzicola mucosus]|uniref:Choline ABC transporter substrate-binding protein n=1 Tax=Oryzicola mucosus TaxID=2767425 RepID=A0A8J6PI58_9HYPH|nr:choline ABC transporter substrate-binding protein [Oryzicola mucosus]MBD0414513.1 choline ABC transporter substrate-binding protein [Oryzicola mucosus]
MTYRRFGLAVAAILLSAPAMAADAESCKTIRMSDPGWTDITSTNAIATVLLEGLGYSTDIQTLSVLVGYQSMKNKDIDVFLGNWMPAQQKFIDELNASNAAEVLGQNLTGAKFTLAVPSYVAEKGIKDFKDLAKHADSFGSQIYGIEPGAPANENMQKMIDSGDFDLSKWSVVESSEAGMLSQVARAEAAKQDIVFLAWAPHPMNTKFDITYLSGGDEYFGANFGGADVYTLARTGWSGECPNAATFFKNLKFTLDIENAMMGKIMDDSMAPNDAAKDWIKANPTALDAWLKDVTTFDGQPGLAAVKTSLGL